MQLREAILLARKHKCTLKCESLRMYEQSAKNILHWLVVDEGPEHEHFRLKQYLEATDWELDFTGFQYHLRVVLGCTPTTLSFKTYRDRSQYIYDFVKKYGSEDDGGDNFIDMRFEGTIEFDSLRK